MDPVAPGGWSSTLRGLTPTVVACRPANPPRRLIGACAIGLHGRIPRPARRGRRQVQGQTGRDSRRSTGPQPSTRPQVSPERGMPAWTHRPRAGNPAGCLSVPSSAAAAHPARRLTRDPPIGTRAGIPREAVPRMPQVPAHKALAPAGKPRKDHRRPNGGRRTSRPMGHPTPGSPAGNLHNVRRLNETT